MQRRHLLKLGLGASSALVLGGGLAAYWQPALQADRLTAAGRHALGALARAVLEHSLPSGREAVDRHLDQLDDVVRSMPTAVRAELQQLFSLCTNAPGRWFLWGDARPLHERSPSDLQARLQSMRTSRFALHQQAYFAFRDLNAAAHFAQPAAWAAMGYPGPRDL